MGVGVGRVREVAAEHDPVGQLEQRGAQVGREGHPGLGEVGEGHRGVEVDAVVAPGQRQERGVLGHAHVGDDGWQGRVPREHLAEDLRSGERPWHGPAAAVHDDRHAGVREHAPHLVQQRVTRIEGADLDVHLDQLDTVAQRLLDVRRSRRLGVAGRGVHDIVVLAGKVARPGVEPAGHAGSVRVDQRRERPDPHRAQPSQPVLLVGAVGDRPGRADQLAGTVEIHPDLVHDVLRHEVHVQVDQPRQPEALPHCRDVSVVHDHRPARGPSAPGPSRPRCRAWPPARTGPGVCRATCAPYLGRSRPWPGRP